MNEFGYIKELSGTQAERLWIEERLGTLSVKESAVLSAAIMRQPPETMRDAVHCLISLENHDVCFPAGNYAQLGSFYLQHEGHLPERAMYYADLDALGRRYEDKCPGLFIGNCYIAYPPSPVVPHYASQGIIPEDSGWSVKVKLSSLAVPKGVWLRLPDHEILTSQPDEVAMALDALKVKELKECTLMEARCILPQFGDLMEQFGDVEELVRMGNDLGYVLEEQGQGMPHFMERFAAAMEYENCRDLRLALDISQNLHCYEWVPCGDLKGFGRQKLLEAGVSKDIVDSGCIDLEGYGADLLEEAGYVLTSDESAYITRNNLKFLYDWSNPEKMEMTLQ